MPDYKLMSALGHEWDAERFEEMDIECRLSFDLYTPSLATACWNGQLVADLFRYAKKLERQLHLAQDFADPHVVAVSEDDGESWTMRGEHDE